MISFNKRIIDLDNAFCEVEAKSIVMRNLDCECRFAIAHGCLLTRVFDDGAGYLFLYPKAFSEDASPEAALREISSYCLRENIPEVLSEVHISELSAALLGVRNAEIYAMSDTTDYYVVEIKTELSMLEGEIDIEYEDISLSLIDVSVAEEYGALASDREHNKYYGYEISDDMPNATPEELVSAAIRDFELCRSLPLAVRNSDGKYIGEAVLYDFDGRGNAEIAFRVAKEYTRLGYGRKILRAAVKIAKDLGLLCIKARVHKDNVSSLKLIKSEGFELACSEDLIHRFSRDLT